jgi:PncC family amidohydrolase
MSEAHEPTLAERLGARLAERGEVLAVAEGATGGLLAHLLTQVPGSSRWFRAGIVAYTDYPKQLLLRVATETIEQRGSISPEATVQMARLARRLFATDWAIAVTGYADDQAPAPDRRAPSVPATNPPGVPRIESERSSPQAGLTYIAISGRAAGAVPAGREDFQSWEEWLLPAPDRATYKQAAAERAIETLLKIIES